MKKIAFILLSTLLCASLYSCSSSNETERADVEDRQNEPMRHNDEAHQPTEIGHQSDEIDENN